MWKKKKEERKTELGQQCKFGLQLGDCNSWVERVSIYYTKSLVPENLGLFV